MKRLIERIWNAIIYLVFALMNLVLYPFAALEYIVFNRDFIWTWSYKATKWCYVGKSTKP